LAIIAKLQTKSSEDLSRVVSNSEVSKWVDRFYARFVQDPTFRNNILALLVLKLQDSAGRCAQPNNVTHNMLISEAQEPGAQDRGFIPENSTTLKNLMVGLKNTVSKLPSEHADMTEAERSIWSVIVEDKLPECMETAFRSLAMIEELFHELKPTQDMYEAYQRQPSLMETSRIDKLRIQKLDDIYREYVGFVERFNKSKAEMNTLLNRASEDAEKYKNESENYKNETEKYKTQFRQTLIERDNYKEHACKFQAQFQETLRDNSDLQAKLDQMTQERNKLQAVVEEYKDVPKGFKPRSGSTYMLYANPDAEVEWKCPLLKLDGSLCSPVNSRWNKLKMEYNVWFERDLCQGCNK
jgi:hypothetical protein